MDSNLTLYRKRVAKLPPGLASYRKLERETGRDHSSLKKWILYRFRKLLGTSLYGII